MVQTVRDGHVTKDLAICMHGTTKVRVEGRPEPSLARPGLACGFIGREALRAALWAAPPLTLPSDPTPHHTTPHQCR